MAGAIAASYRSRWAAWSRRLMVPKPALGVHSRVSMVMTGHPVFGLSWARVSTGHMYLCYYHFHKEVVTCHPSLTTCEKSAGNGRWPCPTTGLDDRATVPIGAAWVGGPIQYDPMQMRRAPTCVRPRRPDGADPTRLYWVHVGGKLPLSNESGNLPGPWIPLRHVAHDGSGSRAGGSRRWFLGEPSVRQRQSALSSCSGGDAASSTRMRTCSSV